MNRPSKRTLVLVFGLAGLAIGVAACGSNSNDTRGATNGLPNLKQELTAQTWELDASASSLGKLTGKQPTLDFTDDGKVSGQGPCNRFHGLYRVIDGKVEIKSLAQTQMACEPDVMTAETAYHKALEATHAVDATDRKAIVLTAGGAKLTFRAQDRAAKIAGLWEIEQVAKSGALSLVIDGTHPTLQFGTDHTLLVRGLCNNLNTTWSIDGPTITIKPGASTRKSCASPAGIMDQEHLVETALEGSKVVTVDGDTLTLGDDKGASLIVARRGDAG